MSACRPPLRRLDARARDSERAPGAIFKLPRRTALHSSAPAPASLTSLALQARLRATRRKPETRAQHESALRRKRSDPRSASKTQIPAGTHTAAASAPSPCTGRPCRAPRAPSIAASPCAPCAALRPAPPAEPAHAGLNPRPSAYTPRALRNTTRGPAQPPGV